MCTTKLLQNCNKIQQVAVRELLKGWMFFIPSYQRGYRWTKTQIFDLCNDLLEYALKPNKNPQAFYSLQPLIIRKAKHLVKGNEMETYEVIDGQQRLTSVYILYRFLMNFKGFKSDEDLKQRKRVEMYNIYYETRPNDYEIIKKIGYETIKQCEIKDIDIAHVINAYNYINQWLYNNKDLEHDCAESTFTLFSNETFDPDVVVDKLFKLLNNSIGTTEPEGNVQFIWYEIDAGKDAIQEFLSENKGKIKLTDTEKIRALFMQRKGSGTAPDSVQLSIAKDWELIENTLHRNDFWSFISNDTKKEDGRINLIFKYIYDRDCVDKSYEGDDKLFRYYYGLFSNRSKSNNTIINEWDKVMEAYRMLQNWYRNPRIYNLVGLLTKEQDVSKEDLSTMAISNIYDAQDVHTTEQFVTKLKQKVCSVIVENIPIVTDGNDSLEIEGDYVNLFYNIPSDKKKIPGLLRFLNVNLLCKQIEGLLKDVDKPDGEKKASDMGRSNRDEQCAIYRFPFEALDAFGWDVEHIDSATTNQLNNPEEQKVWIEEAESAFGAQLTTNEEYSRLKKELESAAGDKQTIISQIIEKIRAFIGEDDGEERKNWIGNLTLLDSGTNKMYKNKIFAIKRKTIHKRVSDGVFVPVCTQNVFNKVFDSCSKDNLRWDINDKKAYHGFILKELNEFKEQYGVNEQ